ncbi:MULTISPECIES: NAD-dependent succinate-semialdehyde dehydrogenase [Pseudonocardia]|uniref:Alpha-ketoglutaric semialdehyde dehydrogenase n=2 Tax=Pseudonocardia TaxID=1847 RepID=A0A1Y2MZU7_PSEAH|nr:MULTISPECIES: NAD-dependent succinate-semialdehyde dehydrogenase [Pseudonocardia]OSY40377.1 Alpha-ketoglutaric semialdehyde dehydrogenase [Pseudonocardia autotrophica]TDN72292.1 succinate-semialdehyde dehydrogenase/glutarate-semialdehyde dehydrogenase [Pseudonocardia autotrophica]BBG03004.1 NAD-dependent succinate-semialdehyde dehydrogenase [Pseudonocardia autotrophica]GEC25094.1 NAD-dependent succinate-semialdehyde dehydrogenase [Pseudonocardia saturnea]
MDYPELSLLVAGTPRSGGGRAVRPVVNPATGAAVGELPLATDDDLDEACEAAATAFPGWAATPAYDRYGVLRRAADLLRERAGEIGRATTLEQGKPVAEATVEVRGAADILDWFAEEGRRVYGRVVPARTPGVRQLVLRKPVGPVAAFTPWNFPITIPARKIGAALATGCTMVIKPDEQTPATALALAGALVEAGLPPGVLSVVFGDPAAVSTWLIRSPQIRKVTFTGSTAVGRQIAALAAEDVKRVTLELGGHAPVLVFDDADLEKAVRLAVLAKFRNAGQICIAPTRFLVQSGVYDEFTDRFAAAIGTVRPGDGLDPATTMGPLAHVRRPPAMAALVADAVEHGAEIAAGGGPVPGAGGHFWEPTLLTGVAPQARVMREEPFGPLAVAVPFGDLDEGLAAANRVPYGLASYAFTADRSTAHAVAEGIEAGMLAVNHFMLTAPETPFGGIKASGYGSEGGTEGVDDYLFSKLVSEA